MERLGPSAPRAAIKRAAAKAALAGLRGGDPALAQLMDRRGRGLFEDRDTRLRQHGESDQRDFPQVDLFQAPHAAGGVTLETISAKPDGKTIHRALAHERQDFARFCEYAFSGQRAAHAAP